MRCSCYGIVTPDIEKETALCSSADREFYKRISVIANSYHNIRTYAEFNSFRVRRVQIVSPQQHFGVGLYNQALSESMDNVLQDYKRKIVEIESEILKNDNLTLSYIYGRIQPYQSLFDVLNKIISCIKDTRAYGCQILAIIQQHLFNGDELVKRSLLQIYEHINGVFVNQITSWLLYGELRDEYKEFFISKIHKDSNETKDTAFSTPSNLDRSTCSMMIKNFSNLLTILMTVKNCSDIDKFDIYCKNNDLKLKRAVCNKLPYSILPKYLIRSSNTSDHKLLFGTHIENMTVKAYKILGFVLCTSEEFHDADTDNFFLLDSVYIIDTKLLPFFIPLSLAQEILFIGKTVLLFEFDPRDLINSSRNLAITLVPLQKNSENKRFTIWEDKESEFHKKLLKLKEPDDSMYHNSKLKLAVKEIKACVTKHLWTVTVEEGKLLQELRLLKDFYLLGRGELFLELLRLSSNILEEPISRTSARDMNQAFQLAARAVFLDNNEDVEKFTFEIPFIKSKNGDHTIEVTQDGWSSILLKYKFNWPLHLLFTPDILAKYNDMFRFLLRIKKTQHDLHSIWKINKQKKGGGTFELHNKLMFVMDNLQHYLQADVLESNFSKLISTCSSTQYFEELKNAHSSYLHDILMQSFLYSSQSGECSEHSYNDEAEINNPVLSNIMDLLKLCDSFCSMGMSNDEDYDEEYYVVGYTQRFDTVMSSLLQLLASRRSQLCGTFLARLLMRLDYNRWFSSTAHLTQSVTNMLY